MFIAYVHLRVLITNKHIFYNYLFWGVNPGVRKENKEKQA